MECSAHCHVSRYDLQNLRLKLERDYSCELLEDSLRVTRGAQADSGLVIFFAYGVVVFWEVSSDQQEMWLDRAQEFALDSLAVSESDEFMFAYGTTAKIAKRTIQLPDQSSLSKLAVSHAIAQSVKLGIFEQTIEETIRKTRHIPVQLAETGKQPMSLKQLRKMMGQLYIERSSINLHFDLLDEPEVFWELEELEPLYAMTRNYLDIQDRITILNQKLEVVGELYSMLSEELKHSHSSRLEWIIIWLIAIEVVFMFAQRIQAFFSA